MIQEKHKRKDKLGEKKRYAETITRSRAPQSIDTEGDRWWFLGSLDHLPEDVEFVSGDWGALEGLSPGQSQHSTGEENHGSRGESAETLH